MNRPFNRENSLVYSSTFSSLDGVPFKIGPKFKPPTQLVEEPVLNIRQSSSVNIDYDFATEEGVLKWAEVRQQQRVAQQMAEAERKAREEVMEDSESEEEDVESRHSPATVSMETPAPPPPTLPKPVIASISNDILTPIPIHKPENAGGTGKTENSVDVTLFESEDDPFDKFERQTLNDIEELKNVFATTEQATKAGNNAQGGQDPKGETADVNYENVNFKKENGHIPNGIVDKTTLLANSDNVDSGEYIAVDPQAKVSPKPKKRKGNKDYKNLPPVPPRPSLMAKSPLPPIGGPCDVSDSAPSSTNQTNVKVQQTQGAPLTQESQTTSEPVYNNVFNSNVYQNVSVDERSTSVAFSKRDPSVQNNSSQSLSVASAGTGQKSRSSDYVNVAPKPVVPARPSEQIFRQSTNSTLNDSDEEDELPISLRRIPLVRPSSKQEAPSVPPPSYDPSWNKYTPLPTPRSGSSTPILSPSSTNSDMSSPGEVDPYLRLSSEAQGLVDRVVVMGFSRPRAARAVERVGQDEKEVIEHLCLVNKLSESGFDAYLAETTLITFKNNMEKSQRFLSLYKQFQELGFQGDKIKDALVQNDLDSEKALDQLTS